MKPILWTKSWAELNKKEFQFFKSISSSNDQANKIKTHTEKPFLILAEQQISPRGQRKKKWIPSDFMASWFWIKSNKNLSSFKAGLALYEIFLKVWPSHLWSLKSPNDIYLDEKKVSGILLETVSCSSKYKIILGLGINVLEKPSLPKSTSIQDHFTVNENLWSTFLTLLYRDFLELT